MNVGDVEKVDIIGNPFNVFNLNTISVDEFILTSDNKFA